MKRTHRLPTPNTLQPGHYIFWQQRTYQVVTIDSDNALLLHVQPLVEGPATQLSLLDLLSIPRTNPSAPLFAPTLEALHQQIEEQYGISQGTTTHDLPDNYIIKARIVTGVVEMVRRLVSEDERRANMHGEVVSRKQAIQRALATVNTTTIGMEVRGTRQDIHLHAGFSSYYKYEQLYDTYSGDEAQIAASFRRSTFRLPRLSAAQFHFIDLCLLLYYGNTRSTKARVYKLAQDILEKRTHGYWIDPVRCGASIPENVVTELLDLKIPLQAILDNQEKAALLTKIELPSPAWFYAYAKYVEVQSDQGEQIITARLGKGIWEQYHLVFDTFVHRAQFPLQYVFADHWLLDAWIVDEETRQKPARLWLTLLIDAYSRSILGMALLYEDPCIESIQQALKHTIWEKTSHRNLGPEQEWACYGIPLQLFLDNAWAHHSHSLENLARVLSRNGTYNSIDLVFRPPYKGRYGAIIERLFKNFSGQIKELVTGAIQSSDPKAIRTAAKQACLLYPDMNRLLHQLILNYQHTPHGELHGMTPHQKWCEGLRSSGFPPVPPCTPAMDRLFMRMHPQTRQVRSRGIPAFGLNYWSAELGGIERVDREGKAVQYNFRYDPIDISRISLFRNGEWVGDGKARELQQADGTYRQISLAEWKMLKHLVKFQEISTEGKTPAELALVNDLQALSKQRTQEKMGMRRNGSKSMPPDTDEPRQAAELVANEAPDMETERVLRFLHG
ncbi:MAG TPA: Mu transposase C-terminal domain-containing protein [Ktedonobacteraceae bacterium]|nr:Mu transposase C-terminal domain-containing protein [Ktedonobacteraceae bacterium]